MKYWAGLLLVALIFLAGISRLGFLTPEHAKFDGSHQLAVCLPGIMVAANTDVILGPLPAEDYRGESLFTEQKVGENAAAAPGAEALAALLSGGYRLEFRATAPVSAVAANPRPAKPATANQPAQPRSSKLFRVTEGEFRFSGAAELRRNGRATLLVEADPAAPLLFAASGTTDYLVSLDKPVPIDKQGRATLDPGTKGELLGGMVDGRSAAKSTAERMARMPFKVSAPLTAHPLLYATPPALAPETTFGDNGSMTLVFSQVGSVGNAQGLTACVMGGDKKGNLLRTTAPVASSQDEPEGLAIRLPAAATVASAGVDFDRALTVVVASADGSYVAHGALILVNRFWAFGAAVFVTGLALLLLLSSRSKSSKGRAAWWSGLFVSDSDNDPSLSLFQIFFWTIITVWGFIYVFIVTGNLLSLTLEMTALLGIAGVGTVGARMIAQSKGGSTSQIAPEASRPAAEPFDFWDMLNTGGKFDLLKLQLFVFTFIIGAFVVSHITVNGAFPALGAETLLLLGVSQGVYLGGKVGGITPVSKVFEAKHRLDGQKSAAAVAATLVGNAKAALDGLESELATIVAKQQAGTALDARETIRHAALPGEIAAAKKRHDELVEAEKKATEQVARWEADLRDAMKAAGLG